MAEPATPAEPSSAAPVEEAPRDKPAGGRATALPAVVRIALVAVPLLLVLAAWRLPPIQDETYYFAWASAPALNYVDHPPGVAWVLAASRALLGAGLLGLRLPSLLALGLTAVLTAASAARLSEPGRAAVTRGLALLLLAGAPMFLIGYLPATPDVLQGAAAALSAYLLVRSLESTSSARVPFFAAFVLVASTLLKHTSGLLALGALGGALATAQGRARVFSRPVLLGVITGLAALAPWVWAELEAGASSSIHFQAERSFSRGEPRGPLALLVVAGGIAVAAGPGAALALAGLVLAPPAGARLRVTSAVLGGGAALLFLACVLPVWAGGGELNWSMPGVVFVLPAAAAHLADRSRALPRPRLVAVTIGLAVVSLVITTLALAHVASPFLPIRAAADTTLRGAGFDALAARAGEEADARGAQVIVTRRYQHASELRYHLEERLPILELGGARRSQYDAWPRPVLCAGDVALVVLSSAGLPPELAWAEPLGEPVHFERTARGEVLDRWTLTAARVARDTFDAGGVCERRRIER